MKKIFLSILGLILLGSAYAQYHPQFKQVIHYNVDSTGTLSNYQLRLEIKTAALIGAGQLQADADDLRFGMNPCDTAAMYRYYIEKGINTDTTVIWVKVPNIIAQTADSFYMFYGDTVAGAGSDFNATFPNAFISSGNATLSSGNTYDWFMVNAGDTVFLNAGDSSIQLNARNVIVHGVIWGKGMGYAPTTSFLSIGQGAGAGGFPQASGAGGAGYGGVGGKGCYDAGDNPGYGGPTYGDAENEYIEMGSSGGNSSNTKGGAGGGRLEINANDVYIKGEMNFDGDPGTLPGGSNGGGGGSGGGLKIICKNLMIDSTAIISCNGGQGSDGTAAPNDGGGGAGGGRLKFFTESFTRYSDSLIARGGRPGTNGSIQGDYGDTGTIRFINITFRETCQAGNIYGLGFVKNDTACNSYTSPSRKYTWTQTGTYYDTLASASGCDSIITFNLVIGYGGSAAYSASACGSYTLPSGKMVYTTNVYIDTVKQAYGCDSIFTVNVTINNPSAATIGITACKTYTLPKGGIVTQSGTYNDTLVNAVGCDSVVTINLNIVNSVSNSINQTACFRYILPKGGIATTSGNYTDTLATASGCDSIITVNLTINTIDTGVTVSGKTLTAMQAAGTYQWVNCGSNYAPINGATGRNYTPSVTGDYAVILSNNNCSDTSGCVNVVISGIAQMADPNALRIYPNPSSGLFQIELAEPAQLTITNMLGEVLLNRTCAGGKSALDLSGQPSGIYLIRVTSENYLVVKEMVITK